MKGNIQLISGLLWLIFSASAEDCPDPALLHPTSINTQAIISAGMIDGLDLYICSIRKTYLKYECKDSKLGNILDTYWGISTIRRTYFQGDTIHFMFEYDTKTYTIKLNETKKMYSYTVSGDKVPANGTCVGKLDKNQSVIEILNVTINMRVSHLKKEIYLLPDALLKQNIMKNCSYISRYCYDRETREHTFWNVATSFKNMSYGYAIFHDVPVYTMTKAPLLQYLLLEQNGYYVAIELIKEANYFPNSSLTYWQTDHYVNVSFHRFFIAMFSLQTKYKKIELKISGSKEKSFNSMRMRCGLQQLEQKFNADHVALCYYYFPLFEIYIIWSFVYAMFNVIVNYCTLRRLGGRGIKKMLCALSHATTNRYICNRQHEGYDDLNVKHAMMSVKMEAQIKALENLMKTIERANQENSTDDTYDYVRACKFKDMSGTSTDSMEKIPAESDNMSTELSNIESTLKDGYMSLINDDTTPEPAL